MYNSGVSGDTNERVAAEEMDNSALNNTKECTVTSNLFMMYYWILMFLLCFATPVLITASLNVFIYSAVKNTTYEVSVDPYWLIL